MVKPPDKDIWAEKLSLLMVFRANWSQRQWRCCEVLPVKSQLTSFQWGEMVHRAARTVPTKHQTVRGTSEQSSLLARCLLYALQSCPCLPRSPSDACFILTSLMNPFVSALTDLSQLSSTVLCLLLVSRNFLSNYSLSLSEIFKIQAFSRDYRTSLTLSLWRPLSQYTLSWDSFVYEAFPLPSVYDSLLPGNSLPQNSSIQVFIVELFKAPALHSPLVTDENSEKRP